MEEENTKQDSFDRHYALLDVFLLLFWFLLTGQIIVVMKGGDLSFYTLFTGIIAASVVTFTVHEFVIRGEERKKSRLTEYLGSLKDIAGLFVDVTLKLILANGILVYQAITLNIEPRIVKIKVDLTSESEVTLISLLITLTPGTLVMDVEEAKENYYLYIHYSYLKAENLVESMKDTVMRWDKMIKGVFV
ncbi:MAG: Na+/H+ antiporter subunit E [Candidatus Thermoplasmatota archaeon]|nr:Na+/H+ antiporter subunit E [Candidatus Thermoplasmatota archaeon]